jgi:hypothetical protein
VEEEQLEGDGHDLADEDEPPEPRTIDVRGGFWAGLIEGFCPAN